MHRIRPVRMRQDWARKVPSGTDAGHTGRNRTDGRAWKISRRSRFVLKAAIFLGVLNFGDAALEEEGGAAARG
ncbi:hypothetical protein ACLOJK_033463 [Asimina triloba]